MTTDTERIAALERRVAELEQRVSEMAGAAVCGEELESVSSAYRAYTLKATRVPEAASEIEPTD